MSAGESIRQAIDALNRHDAAAYTAVYAPNAVVHDPQFAEPLEGGDAIRKDLEDFLRAFPDLQAKVRSVVESDNAYAYEGTFVGTHGGPLATDAGELPATGKRIELDGAVFGRLDGQDRILEERRYYDVAGLLAQLGAMAPAHEAPSPVAAGVGR